MFCFQCEQTAMGKGCTKQGVCGKDHNTAVIQDALVHMAKGVSMYAHRADSLGVQDEEINRFILEALFTTVTNVNFDDDNVERLVRNAVPIRAKAKKIYETACKNKGKTPETLSGPATWEPASTKDALIKQAAEELSILKKKENKGDDINSLEEVITYGLKGMAAYADHAMVLNVTDPSVFSFFFDALNFISEKHSADELLGMTLKVGEVNLRVMELLDKANTDHYGHPEPTHVRITPVKGKAILVSGHDLYDLEALLKQTQDKNINIYTHGEMLPTNAYPGLKKYKHLVGNYGGAWQDQQKEFDEFPGSILMTTNCIQKPKDSYIDRIFTTGLVAFKGVKHVTRENFKPVIDAALNAKGFTEDAPEKRITIGFGRNTVMSVADKVVGAVKAGKIKHFFLIGGCDGAKPGRNYYTDFAQALPKDTVILTLACGKYRFNKLEFGDIDGIPRLLDIGQCNDAYSAIQIAIALSKAFNTDVNSLPLNLILSWYEQKAVVILLSLLHLGIKNIRLGPSLPASVSPHVLNVLVEKFGLTPIGTSAKEDIKAILG